MQEAGAVEAAIRDSPLGLDPSRDSKTIIVGFPKLTTEFRESLVKQAREIGEKAKVRVRRVRTGELKTVKDATKDGGVGKDDIRKMEAQVIAFQHQA